MESEKISQMEPSEEKKYNRGGRALGGLIVLAVGVIWLLKQMHLVFFPHWVFSWPMFLIVWGLYVGIRHRFRGWGGWLFMMLIGGYFLIDEYFTQYQIADYFWPLAIIVFGLYLILRPKRNYTSERYWAKWKHQGEAYQDKYQNKWGNPPYSGQSTGQTSSDDYLDATAIFGGVHRVVISKNFKGGDVVNIFGGADINLTQADFTGTVTLEITQVFGGAKIIVPTDWRVLIKTTSIFAGVEDKRPPALIKENPEKTLIIDGTSIFAGIDIQCY
jgi:predicted membrane protein